MKHPRQLQRQEIITALEAAGAVIKGSAILCPFHPDKNPSAGVFQGRDGVWRFKCQACGFFGDIFDIESKHTGKPLSEVLPKTNQTARQSTHRTAPAQQAETKAPYVYGSLDAIYEYLKKDFAGQLEDVHPYSDTFSMIRWRGGNGKKQMRPVQTTDKGYILEFPDYRPLYRQESLPQAQTVIIVEGEAKADILAGFGFACTTSSGGCKAAGKTDWGLLAGKDCIVWPDADEPGRGYALAVQGILENHNARVKIINPADLDLRDGEDAADFVKQLKAVGNNELEIKQAILDVLSKAKDTGGYSALCCRIEAMVSGQYAALSTGFPVLDKIAPILPGSLTCIPSSPGASKSFWLLQLILFWILLGIRVAVYELEKDLEFHLMRALSQRADNSNFTNPGWVAAHPDIVRAAIIEDRDIIESASKSITVSPLKAPTQDELADWAKRKAENGHKVIAIDPVSLAVRKGEPYQADNDFVGKLLMIARDYHCFIFLVCHPSKGIVLYPDMNQIAGGAIYSRAADSIFWLEKHNPKQSEIRTACGITPAEHNRTVWVLKSRDGCGTGARIAYQFEEQSLTLSETGLIKVEKKGK